MRYALVRMDLPEGSEPRFYCSEGCSGLPPHVTEQKLKAIVLIAPEYCDNCGLRLPYEQAGHLYLPSAPDWGMKEWNARFRYAPPVRRVMDAEAQPEFRFYEITAVVAVQQYEHGRDGLDAVQMLDDSDFLISLKQTELKLSGAGRWPRFTMEQTEEE